MKPTGGNEGLFWALEMQGEFLEERCYRKGVILAYCRFKFGSLIVIYC
jgi:hypothetical protein